MEGGTRRWILLSSIIVLVVLIGIVVWLILSGPIDAEDLARVPGAPSVSEVRSLVTVRERVYPKVDPDDLLRRWRNGMEPYQREIRIVSLEMRNDELEAILGAMEKELEEAWSFNLELEAILDSIMSYLEGVSYV